MIHALSFGVQAHLPLFNNMSDFLLATWHQKALLPLLISVLPPHLLSYTLRDNNSSRGMWIYMAHLFSQEQAD